MPNFKDITGYVSGKLTVVSCTGQKDCNGNYIWECLCECGNTHTVRGASITGKLISSCGCDFKEHVHRTHSMSRSRTYRSWQMMKERCGKRENYEHITYDTRWESFDNFLEDMGVRPEDTSLDRIDGTQGYYKDNCKWSTKSEQSLNHVQRDDVGVVFHAGKWKAGIIFNGKYYYLGRHIKKEDAVAVRKQFEKDNNINVTRV